MKANQSLWVGALWQAAMPNESIESEYMSESVVVSANNVPVEEAQKHPA